MPDMMTDMKALGAKVLKRVEPENYMEIVKEWPETISGSYIVAKALAEEGLVEGFSVFGWDYMYAWTIYGELGLTFYHHRHDQAPGWAAGGYAVGKCKPGLAHVDRRPGLTNLVPGVAWAHATRTPMVVMCSTAPLTWNKKGGAQEIDAEQVFGKMWGGIAKDAHRVLDYHEIPYWIRRAHRECQQEPRGPFVVQIPSNYLQARAHRREYDLWDTAYTDSETRPPEISQGGAKPEDVEQLIDMLLKAEKPMICAGSAVYWSKAWEELAEFAEVTNVPVHCRRQSRGSVPEDHPQHFSGGPRPFVFAETDFAIIIGLEPNFLEGWFQPPLWNKNSKKVVIQESPVLHYLTGAPTNVQLAILGNVKEVLKQMVAVAKEKMPEGPKPWDAFVKRMQEIKESYFTEYTKKKIEAKWEKNPCDGCASPCHAQEAYLKLGAVDWEVLAYEVCQTQDENGCLIIDSFSMSDVCTNKFVARKPGTTLDAGVQMGVGHSLGIGIGLQVARPGVQSVGFVGDSGFGVAAMELETMLKYKLPHCTVVCNNSAWGGRSCVETGFYLRPWKEVSWGQSPAVPYHEMFEPLGVHVEFITAHDQIRPAMERVWKSGKPALVHALGDCSATPPLIVVLALYHAWSWGMTLKDFSPGIREEMGNAGPEYAVATLLYLNGYGIYPEISELAPLAGTTVEACEEILKAEFPRFFFPSK
jgi:acetolactate synthase-1/2/3 large subunit